MGRGVGSGGGLVRQRPPPATETAELPPSSPMEAYAQLSAPAGAGVDNSQRSTTAAVSRAMSDPYTSRSMFRPFA
ncbi:hypothetical protein [Streptomyces sp. PTD5-9]|uniref:hypothetical protein n=1 Tax=Streptomyces sp. PTD5-9 TaxID=3120150 RepID=UPI00300BCA25